MIKDILVNLAVDAERDPVADYAISAAAAFEAHLTGVAFAYDPAIPPGVLDGVSVSIIAEQRERNARAAAAARKTFEERARQAGVNVEGRVIEASLEGSAGRFARLARNHDLSIVAQAQPENPLPDDLTIEATLFDSGRPMLVIPYIMQGGFKVDRVMVCWDGSRNAARAVADAMPILARAGAIDVVTIEHRDRRNEITGADIAHHLARHGLKVDLKPIVAPDTDVANTILSYAADSSADMIVMGGYGHSRLREFILGGATRGVLSAMTVPTLMAH